MNRTSVLVGLWLLALSPSAAQAQSVWEVTPYSVSIWWTMGDEPDLPEGWRRAWDKQLANQLHVAFRAVWDTRIEPPPPALGSLLRDDLTKLNKDVLFESTKVSDRDKVYLVVIDGHQQSYRIQVREFDCLLGHLGPVLEGHVDLLDRVATRTTQMIAHAFSPVVRIERFSENTVGTRLRGAALIQDDQTAGRLRAGDVLLPFDRRVAITGNTDLKNIRIIDWTYLLVADEPDGGTAPTLKVLSGYRQAFRSKRSRRRQQLAIRARPVSTHSTIRLLSRSDDASPLVGYEVHEKGQLETQFLGYTDWRGELTIKATQTPVRTLLVRSGDRVLAKLPVVPGLRPEITAALVDNRQRVEADGFLSGIQTALVDLVAQRESLTTRVRRRIGEGDLQEAERLLNAFRELPTQADFRRQVEQQQRSLSVTDPALRRSIDTMFVDTYRTLGKYLDAGRLRQLESELAAARAR